MVAIPKSSVRIYDGVMPEIVEGLARDVLARADAPGAVSFGSRNVGGWKSQEDFFTWPSVYLAGLRGAIWDACCERLGQNFNGRLVGWAMVNRNGSFHKPHSHGGLLTGIYFVASGDPPVPTIFEAVSGSGSTARIDDVYVAPEPARLITFPPRLFHRVPSYPGTAPRITIAFEVRT